MICGRIRWIGFALAASSAAVVSAVPAFAQSDNLIAANLSSANVARVYVPVDDQLAASVTLPANLKLNDMYRPYVEAMLRLSPTFRRQCVRLANAPSLTIEVQPLRSLYNDVRARTRFWRTPEGNRFASVEIGPSDDQVELIAHEIEHVIEQLDGVDLRARAAMPATGVRVCEDREGSFETVRASRAGRAVAGEVRRPAP